MSKEEEKQGKKTTSFRLFGFRIEAQVEVVASTSTSTEEMETEIKNKKKRKPPTDEGCRRKKARAYNPPEGAVPAAHAGGLEGALHEIGATELTFICSKGLTDSDTEPRQNRLLLPKPCVQERLLGFLTEAEKLRLLGDKRIPAVVFDAEGRRWTTSINFWKSQSYNLNGDWSKLVQACGLSAADHCVEVRAFRHGNGDGEERGLGFVVLHQPK